MEIAVAKDSPLGQYLAELDGEAGEVNLAAGLLSSTPPRAPPAVRRRQRAAATLTCLYDECKSLLSRILLRSELQALDAVYEALDAAWPSWREVHAVELLAVDQADRHTLLHRLEPRAVGAMPSVLLPIVAALAYCYFYCSQTGRRQGSSDGTSASDSLWLLLVVSSLVLGCVVALELMFRLLVARAITRARRLRRAVQSFLTASESFESAFRSSLDLTKKAELASRGYRIGRAFLPPVGRLEKPTDRLQCVELRRLLRSLNDQLIERISTNLKGESEHTYGASPSAFETSSSTNDDTSAPSLLIMALSKRHAVAVLVVENALRSSLLALISPLWEARRGQHAEQTHLVVSMRDGQRRLERSCELFRAWESALERQSRRVSAVVRAETLSSSPESSNRDGQAVKASLQPASDQARQFRQVELHLQELWSACETLGSLVVAARHDRITTGATTDAPSDEQGNISMEKWANRLASSRELMQKRVQELQDAWGAYDQALASALSLSESGNKSTSDPSVGADDISDGQAQNAPPQRVTTPKQPEEDDCTFVFTGTSTGEKDFDLKNILRQQEDASSAPVGRLFVRELRDVLAYREANTRSRTITKDIDNDATGSARAKGVSGAGDAAANPRDLPARHPKVAMRPMDLSAALKSELQGLRLPFANSADEDYGDVLSDGVQ